MLLLFFFRFLLYQNKWILSRKSKRIPNAGLWETSLNTSENHSNTKENNQRGRGQAGFWTTYHQKWFHGLGERSCFGCYFYGFLASRTQSTQCVCWRDCCTDRSSRSFRTRMSGSFLNERHCRHQLSPSSFVNIRGTSSSIVWAISMLICWLVLLWWLPIRILNQIPYVLFNSILLQLEKNNWRLSISPNCECAVNAK